MVQNSDIEKQIFDQARGIADPVARQQFIADACGTDAELHQRIIKLLQAFEQTGSFLEHPAIDPRVVPTQEYTDAVQAGRQIGPYKLLERIGEGGMGEVWVAEQHIPFRRRVALKLIKPGMDTRSVLGRFEAERQALALMDHPNIAKVLDAGTTPDQRPYFVMELVKGTPITTFCDERKLSPRERLELFIPVCQAIQHAHTKGIIHRDIKPSNVLVALYDEQAVPKVIDFGVAKAIGQQLTEKTVYTNFGALVGTPAYMAPEQATFNQLDVDTRADIYALGVLLYELLAGSPPVEPERLQQVALDEVLRWVRDVEPPRPSQRLSTSAAKASIAAVRKSDPLRLTRLIQGELDWIVMKALEKDRGRRYETATGFANDIQCYLSGDPIQAAPPSRIYRLRKFAHQHRVPLLTAGAFVILLMLSVGVASWLAYVARRAEQFAREREFQSQEARQQLEVALEQTDAARRTAERLTADAIVSRVSSEFSPQTLLQWAERLSQISESNQSYRDFMQLSLLGALQFTASYGGSSVRDGTTFDSQLKIHAAERGLLVSTRGYSDLSITDLKSGRQVLHLGAVAEDGARVKRAFVTDSAVLVCDEAGRIHAFSPVNGQRLYSRQITETDARDLSYWQDRIEISPNINCLLYATTPSPVPVGTLTVLDVSTGQLQRVEIQIPESTGLCACLSPDGMRLAVAIPQQHSLELRNTADLKVMSTLPIELPANGHVTDLVFSADGSDLAISYYAYNPRSSKIEIWNVASQTLRAAWIAPEGMQEDFTALKFLDQGILTATHSDSMESGNEFSWNYDFHQQHATSPRGALEHIPFKLLYANQDWLVRSDGQVYQRKSLKVESPPPDRVYSPRLKQFALRGRFLHLEDKIIDLVLEREFPGNYWYQFQYIPETQQVLCGNPEYFQVLVPLDTAQVSLQSLMALTRLLACGELDAKGTFVPWSEEEWQKRYRETLEQGWLAPYQISPLADFLAQPGFWWQRRIEALTQQLSQPIPPADTQRELAHAWSELAKRNDSLEIQLAALSWRAQHESWTPANHLGHQLPLARKFGRDFWLEVGFDSKSLGYPALPLSALAYTAELTAEELQHAVEFHERQRSFWSQVPTAMQRGDINAPSQLLAEAFLRTRAGDHPAALSLLDPLMATVPPQPVFTPSEDAAQQFGVIADPYGYVIQILVTRAIILANQQRDHECLATIEQLKPWLQPLPAPADWQNRLTEKGLPELLVKQFHEIQTRLHPQP